LRETLVVGFATIFVGLIFYALLGLAWGFKITVETAQELTHRVNGSP